MTTPSPGPTPAGWYRDPSGARGFRYWDGVRWTEHRSSTPFALNANGFRGPRLTWNEKVWYTTLVGPGLVATLILVSLSDAGHQGLELGLAPAGVFVGGVLIGGTYWAVNRDKRARAERATAAERDRKAQALVEKERRVEKLGKRNAGLVESALAAVKKVSDSEAARKGWLGDLDFTPDIQAITDNFEKAHALRQVVRELSALDNPSAEDRKLLAEARAAARKLETTANERVELIGECAAKAGLIDQSLRDERAEAKTAAQRAELNAKLSALLYGIEATREPAPADSAAVDAVMSRVAAYQEIQRQIQQARSG